jgi:hypothetical protein
MKRKFHEKSARPQFVENVVGVCGEARARWLDDLPESSPKSQRKNGRSKWKSHFPNLSYNYVAPCVFFTTAIERGFENRFARESFRLFSAKRNFCEFATAAARFDFCNSTKTPRAASRKIDRRARI